MRAVITAGGRIGGAYAAAAGTNVKALAAVRGETMLARIVQALRGAGATQIAVVGGSAVRASCTSTSGVDTFIDERATGEENLLCALRAWPADGDAFLYATSDLPYVTAAAVADFVERVPSGTLAIALTECDALLQRFPEAPPFGIRLAGECIVNGGVFVIPSESSEAIAAIATRLFAARKQPWRMATLISPLIALRFALRQLSVRAIEQIATHTLGVTSIAVRNCAPELSFDADTIAEYEYACSHS